MEPRTTNAEYEQGFHDAIARIRAADPALQHIAFGDLFLEDVRAYRERLCADAGLTPVFPLWGLDTTTLARSFVARGFRAHVVCVDTTQLDASFAGSELDAAFFARLPATVDWCGERGEYHTFVSDGPIFREPVPVVRGEIVLRENRFAYCDLQPVR